jgi:hypothetical protein
MKVKLALVVILALVACDAGADEPVIRAKSSTPAPAPSSTPNRLDGLTLELELATGTVRSGGALRSWLDIKNHSGATIVDPECWLGAARFGLIPADDPEAELWQAIVVDCGGPFRMKDGYIDRHQGPTFQASTTYGDPLPPGDYIAALEIEGFSRRLQQPIEIVAAP